MLRQGIAVDSQLIKARYLRHTKTTGKYGTVGSSQTAGASVEANRIRASICG